MRQKDNLFQHIATFNFLETITLISLQLVIMVWGRGHPW